MILFTLISYLISPIIVVLVLYKVAQFYINNKLKIKPLESYRDKVVIVTGASGGIGSELVKKYADLGSKVVLVARNQGTLENLKKKINQSNKSASLFIVTADLTKESECKSMIEKVIEKYGKIDICVWNAGVGSLIQFEELNQVSSTGNSSDGFKIFKDNMEINYFSLVYSTSFALPYLKQSKGSIIVVSSLAGKFGTALRTSYSASKHAVQGFFNSLRNEIGNKVQITIVCPGFVQTEFHSRVATIDGKPIERESQHFMTADECADLIVNAERSHKREFIPPLKARIGSYIQPILPEFVDYMTNKVAKGSIKNLNQIKD